VPSGAAGRLIRSINDSPPTTNIVPSPRPRRGKL
jgi:hypothetical protein